MGSSCTVRPDLGPVELKALGMSCKSVAGINMCYVGIASCGNCICRCFVAPGLLSVVMSSLAGLDCCNMIIKVCSKDHVKGTRADLT